MRPLAAVLPLALACAVLAACGGDDAGGDAAPPPPSPPPATTEPELEFPSGVVTLETDDREIAVPVEIADTPERRQRGLMFRESLLPGTGMIFLFDADETGGFWMKNTLVPLSIAFADEEGWIVRVLDMEPCRADPCPSYEPGVPYRTALEVNQGELDDWGVEVGDRMTLAP